MIKGITTGANLTVTGGNPTSLYIGSYTGQPGIGNLRMNPSSQNIEVFDGNGWLPMPSSYASIDLSHEVNDLLNWVRQERREQQEYLELAKKHPAVADAIESVKDAKLKLRELAILCQEE